ncbi:MAG: YCF48-related protein [Arenicellales bacterium]|nr:YCF48-related protein [Arenicellales bacterium]
MVRLLSVLTVLLLCLASSTAAQTNQSSVIAPLAPKSLLLDGAAAGEAVVVVGERGHVLKSVDEGQSWRQISVPSRVTLTAVHFIDADYGVVVGHDAVILLSQDGGESWQLVYHAPEAETPLLDVHMHSRKSITAIGGYGLYLDSNDGGSTWAAREFQPIQLNKTEVQTGYADTFVGDLHLNHIAISKTDRWYIAAEAGTLYRSDDQGQSWLQLPSPYEGSFFGTLPIGNNELFAFGLQGRLFYSNNTGESWQRIDTGTQATLTNALVLQDGSIFVSGYSGSMLFSNPDEVDFKLNQLERRMGVSSSIQLKNSDLLLLGTGGILRLPLERLIR